MLHDIRKYTAGRVAKDCPISLDLFAADVELPAQYLLETAVRQTGQEQISIALSDVFSGSKLLVGKLFMPACCIVSGHQQKSSIYAFTTPGACNLGNVLRIP